MAYAGPPAGGRALADIRGTLGDDVIDGTPGPDRIAGLGGDDILRGLGGNDRLFGGAGDDLLRGGPGIDRLAGGADNDRLFGDGGPDVLLGGPGDDELFGNAGRDVLLGGSGRDQFSGGIGDDVLNGGPGADVLTGGPGADTFVTGNVAHGLNTITDFDVGADSLDVWRAVPRFDPGQDVADYVQFRASADGTIVALDPRGSGDRFVDAFLLQGVDVDSLPLDRLGLPETVLATPDPIPPFIVPGEVTVRLVEVAQAPQSPLVPEEPVDAGAIARARLNGLFHAGDGSGRLFTNDTRGQLYVIDEDGRLDPNPVLDMNTEFGDVFFPQNGFWDGLRSFAFHPDFENPGTEGFGKLYLAFTASVASAADHPDTPVFSQNRPGVPVRHHEAIAEVTLDPEALALQPGSYRELMRIESPFTDHNGVTVGFDPNAAPGDAEYGLLYGSVPDGGAPFTGLGAGDPLNQGQDTGTLLGAIIRIDPLPSGDQPYGVPDDNPFLGRPGVLPEIWTYGFRQAQFIAWDPGGDGKMLIADIGNQGAEEVNLGLPGRNYGWSEREGTFVVDRDDRLVLYQLPENEPRDFTYPVAQYGRGADGVAIAGGFVYRGENVPELQGKYIFGDIVNGRIFYTDADELELGRLADISELNLIIDGRPQSFIEALGAARADLRFGQGEDGEVYVLSKRDGSVRMFESLTGPAQAQTASAEALSPDQLLDGSDGIAGLGTGAPAPAGLAPAALAASPHPGVGPGLDDLISTGDPLTA